MKTKTQCPECGVSKNQMHRLWCSHPPMMKLPIINDAQSRTANGGSQQRVVRVSDLRRTKMKTEMTGKQAITLYTTIEALCNQFDRDNLALAAEAESRKYGDRRITDDQQLIAALQEKITHLESALAAHSNVWNSATANKEDK